MGLIKKIISITAILVILYALFAVAMYAKDKSPTEMLEGTPCRLDTDCFDPCPEVISECNDDKCHYIGECGVPLQ